jgi:hypothetical protein
MPVARLAYTLSKLNTNAYLLQVNAHGGGDFDDVILQKPDFKKEGPNLRIKTEGTSILVKFGVGTDGQVEAINGQITVKDALAEIEVIVAS